MIVHIDPLAILLISSLPILALGIWAALQVWRDDHKGKGRAAE